MAKLFPFQHHRARASHCHLSNILPKFSKSILKCKQKNKLMAIYSFWYSKLLLNQTDWLNADLRGPESSILINGNAPSKCVTETKESIIKPLCKLFGKKIRKILKVHLIELFTISRTGLTFFCAQLVEKSTL